MNSARFLMFILTSAGLISGLWASTSNSITGFLMTSTVVILSLIGSTIPIEKLSKTLSNTLGVKGRILDRDEVTQASIWGMASALSLLVYLITPAFFIITGIMFLAAIYSLTKDNLSDNERLQRAGIRFLIGGVFMLAWLNPQLVLIPALAVMGRYVYVYLPRKDKKNLNKTIKKKQLYEDK